MAKKKNKQFAKKRNDLLTCRIIFVILMGIFTIIFLSKLVKSSGYAMSLQVVIYIGLIGVFGYLCWASFSEQWNKKRVLIVSLIGFLLLLTVYIIAFDPVLGSGGDNAEYINAAKSLATFQGFGLINTPETPPITYLPPAFPVLLAPIVRFMGIKIIAFKMVPFCLAILFMFLIPVFFKRYLSLPIALIITLLITTNPQIIHFSSNVLTEIPFLFFSMLSLYFLDKFRREKTIVNKYLFFAGFFIVVTYWTRSTALAFLGTSVLYFILKKDYKKAIMLSIVTLIFFIPWEIRCKMTGVSKFGFIVSAGVKEQGSVLKGAINHIVGNLKIAANIVPQNIFNYKIAGGRILKLNFWIILVLIITITGFIWHIVRQRSQMDLYFLAVPLPIMLFPPIPIQASRYLMVLTPFVIYYFFVGLSLVINQMDRLGISKNISHTIILVIMSVMLFSNLLGTSERIQYAHRSEPYPSAYARFLETASWAKQNTPKDAYFGVRKFATFCLFSDRYAEVYYGKGYGKFDEWSEDAEEKILQMYEEKGMDYVVLDRFSSSAYQLIYPIIRNNPDKFSVVYVTKKPETYVLKLNKWW